MINQDKFWDTVARKDNIWSGVHPCTSQEEFWASGKPHADEVKKVLGFYSPGGSTLKVCDWGCGPGRVAKHLQFAFDLYGYDISKEMMSVLNHWCPFVKHVRELGYVKFDAIYSYSMFIHWDFFSGVDILRLMASCLSLNGVLAVQIPIYRSRRTPNCCNDVGVWSVHDLSYALQHTGLVLEQFSYNDQEFSYESPGSNHNALQVFRRIR